jgi:hypothetical protein
MAANAQPRFTKQANVSAVKVTAANTSSAGGGTVGTDIFKAFTADATNGSFVEKIMWMPCSTAAATATTATTARVFLSSVGTGATTDANTHLVAEISLPAQTADHSTQAVNPFPLPLGINVPAGWFIHVTNHVAPAANTFWKATVIGGDF